MGNKLSRRSALSAVAAAPVVFTNTSCAEAEKEETLHSAGAGFQGSGWSRGPDRTIKKDLVPGTTPVRLSCAAHRLKYPTDMSITERVKEIRDAGYASTGTSYRPEPRNEWLYCPESDIVELKEALKTYDVEFFDMMVWTNMIHPDPVQRQKNLKYIAENIEAAERCGVRNVCACTGGCDPDYFIGMHPDNWTKETWKITVDAVKQLIRDTAGCKTVIGIEAAVTTNIDGPIAHKRIMEDVGDKRCKVSLDATNMFNVMNYYHSTEMLNRCFDMLGEDIICCHGKDTYLERDQMLAMLTMKTAGNGVQDYETYLVRMSRMKWPRTLHLEFAKDPGEYPAVKAFVEETAKKVGVKIYS
jgi:sugar phosphate isomerase/epimerase